MVEDMGIGGRIAALRGRRGLTQEELAGLAGISVSLLRKIEQGVRPVSRFSRLLDLAQALKVRDLSELTGVPLPLAPNGHRAHPAVPAIRAALTTYARSDVEPVSVDDLATRTGLAWTRWQQPGAFRVAQIGQDLPALIRDVRTALTAYDGPERRRALGASVTLYQLVRAWCKQTGEYDLSWVAAERAIGAALDASDVDLIAWSTWSMVATLGAKGLIEEARDVVGQGIAELRPWMSDPPEQRISLWGALHLHTAWQAAVADDEQAVDRALDEAIRASERTGERNDFWTVFGPTNVAVHRASTWVELGRPARALRIGEMVDIEAAPSVERRWSHYLALARAYTQRREDVAAVAMLRRVEAESAEELQLSSMVRELLRELLSRETPAVSRELRPLARLTGVID